MATDINPGQYIPDVGGTMSGVGQAIANNSTTILIGIFVFIILGILYKIATHRILIQKLTPVEGGYVHTSGRYRLVQDKNSKRPSFSPMFGNEKLPAYDSKYFQKINGGVPFLGAMRTITLIFVNKYSPVVCDADGQLHHIDNKRWLFDTHKAEYIKKRKRGDLAYFLGIYAPLVVIIGALGFWIVTIFMQVNVIENFGDMLQDLVRRLGG